MEDRLLCVLYVESVRSIDDLANLGLDVAAARALFIEPECCHQPPIFIELVVLRASLHSTSSAQVSLQARSSNSGSTRCAHRAIYAASGSRQIKRSH